MPTGADGFTALFLTLRKTSVKEALGNLTLVEIAHGVYAVSNPEGSAELELSAKDLKKVRQGDEVVRTENGLTIITPLVKSDTGSQRAHLPAVWEDLLESACFSAALRRGA